MTGAEILSLVTAANAAIHGVMLLFKLFGKLFMFFRFGCNLYDLVDVLYEAAKTPELRRVILRLNGGEKLLAEMDKCEGDAKQVARDVDMTKAEIMKLAYEYHIILEEHKRHALRMKKFDRQQAA